MELAIPIIFLGSLYISNKNKKQENVEGYNNNNGDLLQATLGDSNLITNQPSNNIPQAKHVGKTTQEYKSDFNGQESHFNTNNPKMDMNKTITNVNSLTGNSIDINNFKHNNMTQFIGSKYTQGNGNNFQESKLDNMTGSGSQTITKSENQPLFAPEDNISNQYGMQNQSDFYQSRIVQSTNYSNIKPFESVQVGPGMNDGYNDKGSGGFNSGMESRDKWMPKHVDELRVKTNPKEEYTLDGLQGPANAYNKQYGNIGHTEHNKPDTFYENTPDRWFTTTGVTQGGVVESYNVRQDKDLKRKTTDTYTDTIGGTKSANYTSAGVSGVYNEPKRTILPNSDISASSAVGRGPTNLNEISQSYTNYTNNRALIPDATVDRNNIGGIIGAVVAPFMDIVKAPKREEYLENTSILNVSKTNLSLYKSNNTPTPHTIKETTMYSPEFNINRQQGGNINQRNDITIPYETQRDSSCYENYGCVGGGTHNTKYTDRTQYQNQTTNMVKEQNVVTRHNHGVSSQFNNNMNVSIKKNDSQTKVDNMSRQQTRIREAPPIKELIGGFRKPQILKSESEINNRNESDLLQAFLDNPYTHSLSSVA
jgi:hypothetical protein